MNKLMEFCAWNEIKVSICDVGYYNDENPDVRLTEVEIILFKYFNKAEKHIKLTELIDEGFELEDVCLAFAKDFNEFCEKVGE